jgi:translation initiation factor 1 (eIF-1/SUI1)
LDVSANHPKGTQLPDHKKSTSRGDSIKSSNKNASATVEWQTRPAAAAASAATAITPAEEYNRIRLQVAQVAMQSAKKGSTIKKNQKQTSLTTTMSGFGADIDLKGLLQHLKKSLGCSGTTGSAEKLGLVIQLHGDQCERLRGMYGEHFERIEPVLVRWRVAALPGLVLAES